MNGSVSGEIKKINNLIIREIMFITKREGINNLTPSQIMIIKYLSDSKTPVYQKDISKQFPFRKSTISGIIKTMQKNGLIILNNSKDDLRSKQIELTNLSIDILNKVEKCFKSFDKLITKDINSNELDIFYKVCNQIQYNLKGERNDKDI